MALSFIASKLELLKTLKIVKTALPRGKQRKLTNLELQIGMNKVVMLLPGLSQELYGKTTGIGKAYLPLLQFESMVKDSSTEDIVVQLESGIAKIGKYQSNTSRISLQQLENQTSIDLPVNYTVLDLLTLRKKYSFEQLMANNYIYLINQTENKMTENINKSLRFLKQYGITYDILNDCIQKKIKEK